jgi:hypothetical protein
MHLRMQRVYAFKDGKHKNLSARALLAMIFGDFDFPISLCFVLFAVCIVVSV